MGALDGLDFATLARIFSYPGIDPRQWVSLGLVDPDTPEARSVQYADQDGTQLPYPLVNVTLQPGGQQVSARVMAQVSGNGCGEWHPFVAGDEVVVLVPQGDEAEGCIIIGRLPNGRDSHPTNVAGNDATKNNLGFQRFVEPYAVESGTAIMLRVSSHGAFLSLDPTGNVTLQCGDGHYLAVGADLVGLQTHDTSCLIQMDPAGQSILLQAKGTQLSLANDASSFLSTGILSLATSGGGYGMGHAITLEQVTTLLWAIVTGLGPLFTIPITPPAALAVVNAALLLASTGTVAPFTASIAAALQLPPDPSGTIPGIGRPGLLL